MANPGTHIVLNREYEPTQTRGRLGVYTDDKLVFCCITVEPVWKDNEKQISCIPEGTYKCKKTYSPAFKRTLIEVLNVPGRSGIRVHEMNFSKSSKGCIGPGLIHVDLNKDDKLDAAYSKVALECLMAVTPNEFTLIIT